MKNIIILFFILPIELISQDYLFKNFTFSKNSISIPSKYNSEGEVIIEKTRKAQIINYKNDVFEVNLYHEKVLLNSDDAVERNNKIYIPNRNSESLLVNKVQITLKNGKIIPLKDDNIEKEVDSESGITYHYFAVKGLEKGATIEKIFITLESPNFEDNIIEVQLSRPIVKY